MILDPQPNDFKPDQSHIKSRSPESLRYWILVLGRCNKSTLLFDNPWGGRDVFAVGSMIIKSSHLKSCVTRDYSHADENEVQSIALARPVLECLGVKVPEVYFAGKLNGQAVLIQERIPGVGLNVAWTYLSPTQKKSFKQQTQQILQQLHKIKPPTAHNHPSYTIPDPNPLHNRGIQEREKQILFPESNNDHDHNPDPDFSLMHNDCQPSNLIVDNDKIVGLIDWEMAGSSAGNPLRRFIPIQIRMPNEGRLCGRGAI